MVLFLFEVRLGCKTRELVYNRPNDFVRAQGGSLPFDDWAVVD